MQRGKADIALSHPCFDVSASGRYGRIHLPVVPVCNIQCAYCNRDYDCVNESRPGVTSGVLEPESVITYLDDAITRMPYISVVGIAGPGDAFAEPERTLATLEQVRRYYPELNLCISTNGLAIREHIEDLVSLNVRYVTITMNAVDPDIGQKIVIWAKAGSRLLRGRAAASLLIDRQMEAISSLKSAGITVKVNTVVIPGINDGHCTTIARSISKLGADIHNLIALIPVAGTGFADVLPPLPAELKLLRHLSGAYLPQMQHCARCRADAAGLLHDC